jgi:Bacterial Ig-like domain/Bacterial Ig domain
MKHWQFATFAALALILSACPGGGGTTADTTKPTVSLGSSSSNVTAAGSITLTATAADNVAVTKVEFFDGGTSLGIDSSAGDGFTQSVSLAVSDNGAKSYTATASDAAGNTQTSAAVSVTVNIATVDTTAPTVVSSTPANAGKGVLATDNIVVTFSEPMNKLVTQSAYQSATNGIRPNQVQFTWNTGGTVLTVDPNANLFIANGADPATVVATPYAFQITNLATDLAGNALTSASFTFTTQRRIFQNLPALVGLSGNVRANGTTSLSFLQAGDSGSAANAQYKGFASFDISGIPAGIQTFEVADLNMNQIAVDSTPYTDLGGTLLLDRVNFDTLDLALAFNATSLGAVGTLSTTATIEVKTLSVLAALNNDYTQRVARGNRTQYRLAFPTASDFDGVFDAAGFALPTAAVNPSTLAVTYVLP